MDFRAEYEKWCTDPYFDEATKAELKAIAGDDKEIEDRFYRTLEFGTAGLRGVIGAGTNRMNIYTVRQATQGLANYILSQGEDAVKRGVAIAHDSRNMHDEFTDATALCLAANGIKTYVFPQLAPVPELSYAVRTLGTIAGVVITASHNPREYNGYKVYWEDGAQVTPPHDTSIMAEVAKVTSFDQVKTMDKAAAIEAGLYNVISDEVEEGYFGELRKLSIHPEIIKAMAKDKIGLSIKQLTPPPPAPPKPQRPVSQERRAPKVAPPVSFEDKLSRFLKDSDDRLLDLKRNTESKRGGRGASRDR